MKKLQILIFILIFAIVSCGEDESRILTGTVTEDVTVKDGEEITIKGKVTISNGAVVRFGAGSKIKFEIVKQSTVQGDVYEAASIKFTDSSYVIAEGTKEKIIEFYPEDPAAGAIFIEETANGDSCSFKYCLFKINAGLEFTHVNAVFSYNKLIKSGLDIQNDTAVIIYNTFNEGGIIVCGDTMSTPIIKYNQMESSRISCYLYTKPSILYNNIINNDYHAVGRSYLDTIPIESNYISNCNKQKGFSGLDTTGVQSSGVIYINPRTEPVSEAGCGW